MGRLDRKNLAIVLLFFVKIENYTGQTKEIVIKYN